MEIKKVLMSNGNEYEVLWDDNLNTDGLYELVDLEKGWIKINKNHISEIIPVGPLKNKESIRPEIKKIIDDQYGFD